MKRPFLSQNVFSGWLAPVAVLVAAFGLWVWRERQAYISAQPPGLKCTPTELAGKVPKPVRLAVISAYGSRRLIWIGRVPRFTLNSGPPCYVFDESGVLVDWCSNTGERWSGDSLMGDAYKAPSMSLEEAVRWCTDRNSTR
jgi:hypothetical protein